MNFPGLCGACRWARIVESRRGSRFYMCGRSRFDPAFPKSPGLPVLRCVGFEPLAADAAVTQEDPDD